MGHVINLHEYKSIGNHWIALYVNGNNEHIPKEIKKFIGNKTVKTNIYRIQAYNSIMCWYFCIGFIDFILKCKSLSDYTYLFSPNQYEKNDKKILKYFQ